MKLDASQMLALRGRVSSRASRTPFTGKHLARQGAHDVVEGWKGLLQLRNAFLIFLGQAFGLENSFRIREQLPAKLGVDYRLCEHLFAQVFFLSATALGSRSFRGGPLLSGWFFCGHTKIPPYDERRCAARFFFYRYRI